LREPLEKGEPHQGKLLLRQGIECKLHAFFALSGVKAIVTAFGGIGNGEKILGREAEFAAASPQVDATIAGDLKDPGDRRRFLRIVQMRLRQIVSITSWVTSSAAIVASPRRTICACTRSRKWSNRTVKASSSWLVPTAIRRWSEWIARGGGHLRRQDASSVCTREVGFTALVAVKPRVRMPGRKRAAPLRAALGYRRIIGALPV